MTHSWISTNNSGISHFYYSSISLCKQVTLTNSSQPSPASLNTVHDTKHQCKLCINILKSNQYKKSKVEEKRLEIKHEKYYKEFEIYPVDALCNHITHPDTKPCANLDLLSVETFGVTITPDEVLAQAIIEKRLCFVDGVIYPIINEEVIL